MLGAGPDVHYPSASLPMATGDVLVLYTDGLIDEPGRYGGDGPGRLREALAVEVPVGSESALNDLLRRVTQQNPGDDACVLAAQATGVDRAAEVALMDRTFDRSSLAETRDAIGDLAAAEGLTEMARYKFVLAIHELTTNAVRHGGGHGRLRIWRTGGALWCEISDQGRGLSRKRRDRPQPGHIGGWGLWLVGEICESVDIDTGRSGTCVRVRYVPPS
jgi:anti-sigma regulatory factor (Ser/Thr protein kinase)